MHSSPIFRGTDADARAVIDAAPLATVAVNGDTGPVVALAPLVWREDGRGLLGHVSRANPFWRCAETGPVEVVAVFVQGDAYVSPSAYPSKADHGRVVPTWNYVAAEVRGQLTLETNPHLMRGYIEPLTNRMEDGRAAPWSVDDAPEDYTARLSAGIVGFEIEVTALTCIRKLSQNKGASDRAGVQAAFEAENGALAREMERE